ncbi:hypothetical protein ACQ4M3_39785 [Leptolyngbya sp. AN03gr2]|uniref:hypothetical protein n=1 Tax=unclassified Leptolyngbya TaxID=2650499 RepID=UPI003D311CBE
MNVGLQHNKADRIFIAVLETGLWLLSRIWRRKSMSATDFMNTVVRDLVKTHGLQVLMALKYSGFDLEICEPNSGRFSYWFRGDCLGLAENYFYTCDLDDEHWAFSTRWDAARTPIWSRGASLTLAKLADAKREDIGHFVSF